MQVCLPVLLLLVVAASKVINSDRERHFELEVGSLLNEPIPIIFLKYQHSSLVTLHAGKPSVTRSPICEIRLKESGILREINAIHYGPQPRARDQIITDLESLRALRTFMDSVVVEETVFALFEGGMVVQYRVNSTSGLLSQEGNFSMGFGPDAQFLMLQKDVFVVSAEKLERVRPQGEGVTKLGINGSIYGAVGEGDIIFVAAGRQGVYSYRYDRKKDSAALVGITTFYISQETGKTPFAAHQIHVNLQQQMIYVLDHEQGLLAASFNLPQGNGSIQGKPKMLASGCRNLHVTSYRFYLTCPELVQLDRESGTAVQVTNLDFYAVEVAMKGQRLYLFGRRDWAVYDLLGRMLSSQRLPFPMEKGMVIGNYLLAFSDKEAASFSIISQREQLYCYTSEAEAVGNYEGRYETEGLCQEYFDQPQNTTDVCVYNYPFTLKITDSAVPDYTVQIVIAGAWLFLIFSVSLFFAIKNFLVHRSYRELLQEQSGVDLGNEGEKEYDREKKSEIVSTV